MGGPPEPPGATAHENAPVHRQPPHHPRFPILRGEDSLLVRPYVLSLDKWRHEKRQQRQRRRALWLATHGIDIGPRWIHGMEVAA